jgi:hypothetical protein
MTHVKMFIRSLGLHIARMVGTNLHDAQTGEVLGKALVIPWRGKLLVIGLEQPVVPIFLPQKRLTYWRQDLGFTTHPPPDYPREAP